MVRGRFVVQHFAAANMVVRKRNGFSQLSRQIVDSIKWHGTSILSTMLHFCCTFNYFQQSRTAWILLENLSHGSHVIEGKTLCYIFLLHGWVKVWHLILSLKQSTLEGFAASQIIDDEYWNAFYGYVQRIIAMSILCSVQLRWKLAIFIQPQE